MDHLFDFQRVFHADEVRLVLTHGHGFSAAQIGFIAAGAVGLAAGCFIARTAVPAWPERVAWGKAMRAFLLMISMAAATLGNLMGMKTSVGEWLWHDLGDSLGVADMPAFLRVALIHTAGYVGALAGLALAILRLRRTTIGS